MDLAARLPRAEGSIAGARTSSVSCLELPMFVLLG